MKNLILFFLLSAGSPVVAQYRQQQVDYRLHVTLYDRDNTLDGFERLTYTNHSPDTLTYIPFHLWPNAYKNDKTAFSNDLLQNGSTAFYFSTREQRGYINRLDFKVNGIAAKAEDHPEHIDIINLLLPKPLPPSGSVTITTPFHVKLPFNFSRGGFAGGSYQLTQWYPKPAVYDAGGWHPMPYLDQGEFYSEFGSFDVSVTVPADYVVAATGVLQNEEEKAWMKEHKPLPEVKKNTVKRGSAPVVKREAPVETLPVPLATKTLRYLQDNIHDFAIFVDKNFIVDRDTCQLASGKVIDVYTYYTPPYASTWKNSVQFCKNAVRFYSEEVGEYPYTVVSAVQGPESFGGGMEYPTITIISPTPSEKELDVTIAHEIGHNWFYGILASNERDHPWMDEGINSFYEKKYTERYYGPQTREEEILFQNAAVRKRDQPIQTTSQKFSEQNYALVAYHKTAQWVSLLEQKMGAQPFKEAMHHYFDTWKFRHPQPEDFKGIFHASSGSSTDSLFLLLGTRGILPGQAFTGFKTVTPLRKNSIKHYLQTPSKNAVLFSPAIGFNSYDGVMPGVVFSNYKLPPSPFQFGAVPLYGTRSKKVAGLGKLSYSVYPDKGVQRFELFLNGSLFSINEFRDSKGTKTTFGVSKLVPGFEITFKEKDPRSTVKKYLQLKGFYIGEQGLRLRFDSLITPVDTTIIDVVQKERVRYNVSRLTLGIEDHRALYPYSANVVLEGSSRFIRLSFTSDYFFNYATGGGLDLRFFAGKFFYTGNKHYPAGYNIGRFYLNMTGANGEEDYTYSDYFVGRNKFEEAASQQIVVRDGGFKFRTDLLSNKVGKSDDWLMAANFTSTLPEKINPLSILPIKIPLKIFADIGTYAEAWKRGGETDHFLFDAGLQLPLLKEAVNLYIPLFYSNVYRDYYNSYLSDKKFLKKISFSINLYNKKVKDVQQQLFF